MCLGLSPFYSIWGESWGISGPVHACRAGSSLEMVDLKFVISHSLCLSVSLSLSLSHTLSFVRGVVQSVALERYLFLPFLAGFRDPSSEKLTGPVQFPVSSPLSRLNCCALVRKWVSLFGIYFPHCANVKHILPIAYVQSQNPEKVVPLHTHTCTYRGRGDQLFG